MERAWGTAIEMIPTRPLVISRRDSNHTSASCWLEGTRGKEYCVHLLIDEDVSFIFKSNAWPALRLLVCVSSVCPCVCGIHKLIVSECREISFIHAVFVILSSILCFSKPNGR